MGNQSTAGPVDANLSPGRAQILTGKPATITLVSPGRLRNAATSSTSGTSPNRVFSTATAVGSISDSNEVCNPAA